MEGSGPIRMTQRNHLISLWKPNVAPTGSKSVKIRAAQSHKSKYISRNSALSVAFM